MHLHDTSRATPALHERFSEKVGDDRPIISPAMLLHQIPQTAKSRSVVSTSRYEAAKILNGTDPGDRILVLIGPCSIHNAEAALEYCQLLLKEKEKHQAELLIVMRAYVEKPRSTIGWKGLINDPDINGTFNINGGLKTARELLVEITGKGMPVASELLDTLSPLYLADLFSVGAIGARTTESQLHRELASGLPFPVGFKNSTSGSASTAVDAIYAANHPHHFISANTFGVLSIVKTGGNEDCFLVLRGTSSGPNYDVANVRKAKETLRKAGAREKVMIDCSHMNSLKDYRNQPAVAMNVASQISHGERAIAGVMVESFIHEGTQKVCPGNNDKLQYGVSITDGCIGWQDTVTLLQVLADSVKERRKVRNGGQ